MQPTVSKPYLEISFLRGVALLAHVPEREHDPFCRRAGEDVCGGGGGGGGHGGGGERGQQLTSRDVCRRLNMCEAFVTKPAQLDTLQFTYVKQ